MSNAPAAEGSEPVRSLLSPHKAAFVREYLVDMVADRAAIRAGYASAAGLFNDADVKAAVEQGLEQRRSRVEMKQDDVLHELSFLSHSCIEHYTVSDDGRVELAPGAPEGAMRAIQSIKRKTRLFPGGVRTYEVEVRLWDKPGPLKLMGRHLGLFPDRVEHVGKDGGPIAITEIRSVIVDPKVEGDEA